MEEDAKEILLSVSWILFMSSPTVTLEFSAKAFLAFSSNSFLSMLLVTLLGLYPPNLVTLVVLFKLLSRSLNYVMPKPFCSLGDYAAAFHATLAL